MIVNTQYQPISIRVEFFFELLHEFFPANVKQLVNVPKTYLGGVANLNSSLLVLSCGE